MIKSEMKLRDEMHRAVKKTLQILDIIKVVKAKWTSEKISY